MRNVFAGFLGIVALLAGLLGVVLQWVDHSARDPRPTEQVALAVAEDPAVHTAVAQEVTQRLEDSLKQVDLPYEQLTQQLTEAVEVTVEEVLADQGFDTAWRTILGQSRERLVADLDAWRSGDPSPDLTLNLTPIAHLVLDQLKTHGDPAVALAAEHIEVPDQMVMTGTRLEDRVTEIASPTLQLAQLWQAFLLLAAVVLLLAVAFARPRGRGVVLLLVGLFAAGGGALLRYLLDQVGLPGRGQATLVQTMATVATRQLTSSLAASLMLLVWVGLAMTVVGLTWWVIAARRHPAHPRPGR
ncbi:MAG: hypothetical protein Q4D89_08360 [Arachnia propionica]|uniref:hypothetical protein n=1 Tax=Arachnia propionica TaxID=1750 RepID=UPI0026FE073B|nr:hypothetical protein [Arachnia propionica]